MWYGTQQNRLADCLPLQALGYGPPELVTCGRDGCVRVWDVRQEDAPVAAFEPADSNNIRCVGLTVLLHDGSC